MGPFTFSASDGKLKENPHAWSNDYNASWRFAWDRARKVGNSLLGTSMVFLSVLGQYRMY